jgi:hypothetical protein
MAISHDSFTVGTSPTLIATLPAGNPTTMVTVINDDNSAVYIGDSAVTSSAGVDKGVPIVKNTSYNFALNAGDKLYAVSAAGTASYAVSVLYSKVVI